MLVVMKAEATEAETAALCGTLEQLGVRSHPVRGALRTTICPAGTVSEADSLRLGSMPGVERLLHPTHGYRLASRETQPETTLIQLTANHSALGSQKIALLGLGSAAEPLSENEACFLRDMGLTAVLVPRALGTSAGVQIDRAGWQAVRQSFGFALIVEVYDQATLDEASSWADMVSVGARNMQNFSLLKAAGRQAKPVLVERGHSATLEEFLMAAEYVLSEGNPWVALLEAGVRSFAAHTRNTLDLSLLPLLNQLTHLPVLVAPALATGQPLCTPALCRASVAAGADGLLLDLSAERSTGSTSAQPYQELRALIDDLSKIAPIVGRTLNEEKHAL